MAIMLCEPPLWTDGRPSTCVQTSYPIGLTAISAAIVIASHVYNFSSSRRQEGFEPLHTDENHPTSDITPGRCRTLRLSGTKSIVEAFVLLSDVAFCAFGIATNWNDSDNKPHLLGSIIISIYLTLLLTGRQLDGKYFRRRGISPSWEFHSLVLYLGHWAFTALLVYSEATDGSKENVWYIELVLRLTFFALVVLLYLSAPLVSDEVTNADSNELGSSQNASILSRLTFHWIEKLIWKAYRAKIEANNLPTLNYDHQTHIVSGRFHANTNKCQALIRRLFRHFAFELLYQGIWACLMSFTVFVPALLIRLILNFLQSPEGEDMSIRTAWASVLGLLVSGIATAVSESQTEWAGQSIAVRVRAILASEIYAKILRRKGSQGNQATDGNIINLMTTDSEIISFMSANLHLVWVVFPVQLTIGIWSLYGLLGVSGILGVATMVALLPLNFLVSKQQIKAQGKVLAASDIRIQSSNEVLHNIRTIKYSAWEKSFGDRVITKRREELKLLRTRFIWWSLSLTLFHSLPLIVTIFTCFFYTVVWNNELGTAKAFPALVIFTVIRIPLDRMSDSISFLLQAHVSLTRISNFLHGEETAKYDQLRSKYADVEDTEIIGFKDATCTWEIADAESSSPGQNAVMTEPASPFKLSNLSISFCQSGLNIISGPSGSGKSSILLSLLGEMNLVSGKVCIPHEVKKQDLMSSQNPEDFKLSKTSAFCPQEPWIMNQTIRNNILLGMPLIAKRYEEVLQAVALNHDLQDLKNGDQTLAGESGARLSGGQKQRVALARALYSTAKFVLLDDCLSALDSKTARHTFLNAVKGPLMKDRTCILATHSTELTIPDADFVVVLNNGNVVAQGTPQHLLSAGLIKLKDENGRSQEQNIGTVEDEISVPSTESSINPSKNDNIEENESENEYTEKSSEGAVSWSIIASYLTSMGPRSYWMLVLTGFVGQQLVALGTNLWIKNWALQYDRTAEDHRTKGETNKVNAVYYLGVYVSICFAYAVTSFIRDGTTFFGSLKASSRLYSRLLHSVMHAKLTFFDRVPLGQIVNRFSKDIGVVDEHLAGFSISALQLFTSLVMAIILISVIVPGFLLVAVFICLAYCCITVIFSEGSRDLKRIEAVERSPLYQKAGETISGRVSIRAYAYEASFVSQNNRLVDRLNGPYILQWATKEWITFRVGLLSSLVLFFTGSFIIWNAKSINPGSAGLVLTYAATFTETIMFLVQIWAIIQQNLNSVDRIIEYTNVEQEHEKPLKPTREHLSFHWPANGIVKAFEYSTSYAKGLEPALKDINFTFHAGERIAIVGRTGSGKSTLALSLIRALEADSGSITIDDVDITSVSLERLRQVITVVAQDPVLFEGSIRDNIDPLRQHGDDEVIAVLRTVYFDANDVDGGREVRSDMDESTSGYSSPTSRLNLISRPASSFSRGQRQLLCIARGLIRKSSVLILDEATASVDQATDEKIQAGLRASVKSGTTVITIAHRLRTIADYDKVIVLDAGRIVEEGRVMDLLGKSRHEGIFRALCEESGDLETIEKIAADEHI